MKTWDYASAGGSKKETGCCSLDSINDARAIAVELGFPHYIIDIRKEFGNHVIDNFVDEYLAGRTPNPCVMCNTHIKVGGVASSVPNMLDCEFIATGHYANVRERKMPTGGSLFPRALTIGKIKAMCFGEFLRNVCRERCFP